MSKIIIPLLILSLALNTYLLIGKEKAAKYHSEVQSAALESNQTKSTVLDTNNINDREKDELIAMLSDKLEKSRSEVSRLQRQVEGLESEMSAAKLNQELEPKKDVVENKDESEQKPYESMTIEEMRKQGDAQVARYESDTIDQDWAYKTQRDLAEIVNNSDLLGKVSLNEIDCRSTSCRVSVTPLQQGSGASVGAYFDFLKLLQEDSNYKDFDSISRDNSEDNTVYIYLEESSGGH
ncbi:hypothetical protein [Kangiella marina]|uniref:Uncharacterized protein n=1 Tax=Kangiella marina TaxID=1079178 RepID=A0ABP8IMC1_9GAMM